MSVCLSICKVVPNLKYDIRLWIYVKILNRRMKDFILALDYFESQLLWKNFEKCKNIKQL